VGNSGGGEGGHRSENTRSSQASRTAGAVGGTRKKSVGLSLTPRSKRENDITCGKKVNEGIAEEMVCQVFHPVKKSDQGKGQLEEQGGNFI